MRRIPEILEIPMIILEVVIFIPLSLLGFWRCNSCGKIGWIDSNRKTMCSFTGDEIYFCDKCMKGVN